MQLQAIFADPSNKATQSAHGESSVLGLGAVLAAALLSSGASVYFELALKTPPRSGLGLG